ncbi:MAG TPA: PilZ domain-containing protein [Blastocatellia bacterium]|nr:PilZ domain-containing protein [Blastocatellia bacterium]
MTSPPQERRRAARQQLIVDLFYDGAEGVGIAQTRDINAHGLYFNTLAIIPKGARLKLRVPVDPEREEYLVLDGIVVYSQPKVGVAVEFESVSAEVQIRLERLITEEQQRRVNEWEVAGV